MAHKRESDTTTPSLANQGTDTGQKGNQHIAHEKEPSKTGRVISDRPVHIQTVTVQGDDTNTSKSEKVNPQGYRLEPPRLPGLSRIWSVCPIITFVCLVCLALSIHAHREKVSTIIDFMMVLFSLEQHKAHYLQVSCQESVGNNYQIHRSQLNPKTSETHAYRRISHTRNSKRTEGMRRTAWIKQRYEENTPDRGKTKQTQELVETPADRQRELAQDAT